MYVSNMYKMIYIIIIIIIKNYIYIIKRDIKRIYLQVKFSRRKSFINLEI